MPSFHPRFRPSRRQVLGGGASALVGLTFLPRFALSEEEKKLFDKEHKEIETSYNKRIGEQFRKSGLVPMGDYGSWFQWFNMRRTRVSTVSSSVSIGGRPLALWTEVTPTSNAPAPMYLYFVLLLMLVCP